MPATARDAEPVPSSPTHETLAELQSELGEVEWLGRALRERPRDPFFVDADNHEAAVWQRLLAWTH